MGKGSGGPEPRAWVAREMKVIAVYLLAVLGGKTRTEDIKSILGAVGAEADDDRLQFLLKEVEGKDITELIASGREKLATEAALDLVAVMSVENYV